MSISLKPRCRKPGAVGGKAGKAPCWEWGLGVGGTPSPPYQGTPLVRRAKPTRDHADAITTTYQPYKKFLK